ncbi:MAG: S41 family peptidase [Nitrospinales bacterium]
MSIHNTIQKIFHPTVLYRGLVLRVCLAFLVLIVASPVAFARDSGLDHLGKKADTYQKLKVFSEIISLLEENYVKEVDPDELINGAIRGMLKTLDPHTTYLTPDSYKEMRVETSGKFGGLGIEISIRDGMLTVVSPIEDTPAYKAGIKPGDRIIQIEDDSTLDMSLPDAVDKLRGKPGDPVNIMVFRESFSDPKVFTIVRAIIKVKGVKHKVYNKNVGYIKIRSFAKTTSNDLDAALRKLKQQGISKLILDLRNNPGGLLNQAVEVTDRFLGNENLIVYTSGRNEDQNTRFTTHPKLGYMKVDYPMIILVNGGSASASEIVAGALQDLGRAVVLGTQTFGKGSVQTIMPLSDGSALRLTTARYYTPSGKVIQENGIKPDIVVEQPLRLAESKKEEEIKENKEKEKIRKFLREKDLKKHLKGKTPNNEDPEEETEEEQAAELEKELREDAQLREAVALLTGWEVMSKNIR